MQTDLSDRSCYVPSGRVNPAALLPWLLLLAIAALLLALGLYGLVQGGVYPLGITCLLPGFGLGYLTALVVQGSHCRGRGLGILFGAAAGLLALAGSYHLDQCGRWGVPWQRLDRLPGYIVFRMETDRVEWTYKWWGIIPEEPQPGVDPSRPLRFHASWPWLGLLGDLAMLTIAPAALGFTRAANPYSESVRRWYARETLTLAPEEGPRLVQALQDSTVAAWAERGPGVAPHQKHSPITVWYCPARGDEVEPTVYLSVETYKLLRLTPEEAGQLTLLVPALADLAGPALPELIAEAEQSDDPSAARVWPVPAPYAGRIQSLGARRIRRLIFVSVALVPVLGFGVLVGGAYVIDQLIKANQVGKWAMIAWALGCGLALLALLYWYFSQGLTIPTRAARRYDRARLRQEIAGRPDPLVAASDARAVFVEMCPRRNFGAARKDHAPAEQGLLAVDYEQRVVLFEGDHHRYRLPAASVVGCSTELFGDPLPTTHSYYAVVVRVRLGTGTWEFPFFPLGQITGRNNWERAEALRLRITQLVGLPGGPEPPPPPPTVHVVV